MTVNWKRRLTHINDPQAVVEISIGPLERDSANGDFICHWHIEGLSRPRSGQVFGVDEIQAVLLAMKMLQQRMEDTEEFIAGIVYWAGGMDKSDLGLPLTH